METVDLCGLRCPMPVLRLKRLLKTTEPGEEVAVATDDPHALADIRIFAEQSGHEVLSQTTQGEVTVHRVRHRAKAAP